MYTESVGSEIEFLGDLLKCYGTSMADGETVFVRKCPNCHNGNVFTRCASGEENGNQFWQYHHFCDTCGERYEISRLQSDIFFHKTYIIADKVQTPFGDVQVKINGYVMPFRYWNSTENFWEKPLLLHIINIDLSELKPEDVITCGFEKDILEINSSDERSVIYSCENEKLLLGFCAYETYEWEMEYYCYQLENCGGKGFRYKVISNPADFDVSQFYQSKIISLAIAWINKDDYKDPDLGIFLSLTSEIG